MASEESNIPTPDSEKPTTATPFNNSMLNSEMLKAMMSEPSLLQNILAACLNTKNVEVQSIKQEKIEEPRKQLTLDSWVQKGVSNSKEKTSVDSSTMRQKLSTKNNAKSQQVGFQDNSTESIPGTSFTSDFADIQPDSFQQPACMISKDKLVSVEKEPDKSEAVIYAQLLRTLSQSSGNSLTFLVDQNNPVNLNAEASALVYIDSNNRSNSDLHLNVHKENNSNIVIPSETEICEDVQIVYDSQESAFLNNLNSIVDTDMPSNEMDIMNSIIYVDEGGNLLPVSHVETTNMSSDFLNPDPNGFYTITENSFEAPLPDENNRKNECSPSIESDSSLNVEKSLKKILPSLRVRKTISKEKDAEISDSILTTNSPQQIDSSFEKEDSPSRFLLSPRQVRRQNKKRCEEFSKQLDKSQNSFYDPCLVKENNLLEFDDTTVIKKQTPIKSPNIFSWEVNKVNTGKMTNETVSFKNQNEMDILVNRNEELSLVTTDSSQLIDIAFDDNSASERKSSNQSSINKKRPVKAKKRKLQEQNKESPKSEECSSEKQSRDNLNKSQPFDNLSKNSDENENCDADQTILEGYVEKQLESNSLKRNVKSRTLPKQKRNNQGQCKSVDEPTSIPNLTPFDETPYEGPSMQSGNNTPPLLEKNLNQVSETSPSPIAYNLRRRSGSSSYPSLLQHKRSKRKKSKDRDGKQSSRSKQVCEVSEMKDISCDSLKESSKEANCIAVENVSIFESNSEGNLEALETKKALKVGNKFDRSSPSCKNQQISPISPKFITSNKVLSTLSFYMSDNNMSDVLSQSPLHESEEDCSVVSVDKKRETRKSKETNKRKKHNFESSTSDSTDCIVPDGPSNKKIKHAAKKNGACTNTPDYISDPKMSSQSKRRSGSHKKQKISFQVQKHDSSQELMNKSNCTDAKKDLNVLDQKQYPDANDDILLSDSITHEHADHDSNHEKKKLSKEKVEVHHLTDKNAKKLLKKIPNSKSRKNYMVISDSESSENKVQASVVTKCNELTNVLNVARSFDSQNKSPSKEVDVIKEKQNKEPGNVSKKCSSSSKHPKHRYCTSESDDISFDTELISPKANLDNNTFNKERSLSLTPNQDEIDSNFQMKKTSSKKEQNDVQTLMQKKPSKEVSVSTVPNKEPKNSYQSKSKKKLSAKKPKTNDFDNQNINNSDLKPSEEVRTSTKSSKCIGSQNVQQIDSTSPNFRKEKMSIEIGNLVSTKNLQENSVSIEHDATCILKQSHDIHVDCLPTSEQEGKSSEKSKKKLTKGKPNEGEIISRNENLKPAANKNSLSSKTSPNKKEENVDFISSKDKNKKKIQWRVKPRSIKKKANLKSTKCVSKKSLNVSPESYKNSVDHTIESVLSTDHYSKDSSADEGLQGKIELKESKISESDKVSILEHTQTQVERLKDDFPAKGELEDTTERENIKLKTQQNKSQILKSDKIKSNSDIKHNSIDARKGNSSLLTVNVDNNSCTENDKSCSYKNDKSYDYLVKQMIPNSRIPVLCLEKLDLRVQTSSINFKGTEPNPSLKKVYSNFSDEESNEITSSRNSRHNFPKKLSSSSSKSSTSSELSELGSINMHSCKEKYMVDQKINREKEKDTSSFESCKSGNLHRKGTKRKVSETLETDCEENENTVTHGKSPLSYQELEHNQLNLSCGHNEIECTDNDLLTSASSSCTETTDSDDTFSRFLEFIQKEHKHFAKMIGTKKMANFISNVAAHPNGTVIIIPSQNMDNPEEGPGLILYEKQFFQTTGAV